MPRNISHLVLLCGLLTMTVVAGGCQRGPTWNLAPVEGTVTKAGRPLADVQVVFLADAAAGGQGPRISGTTDAAGHYELRTDAGDRGAAVGHYRVCIVDLKKQEAEVSGKKKDKAAKPAVSDAVQLPPAYSSFEKTPLRVEVQPGAQVIDLDVK